MKPTTLVVDAGQFSANYNHCLLHALAERGERVVYATTEYAHGHVPDPHGVTVFRCFFFLARLAARLTPSASVRRALRAIEYPLDWLLLLAYILIRRIRVIHLMWVVSPPLDHHLIRLLQGMGCRVVHTAHNPFPHEPGPNDVDNYCRIYRQVDHVITLTRFTADEIASRCGLDATDLSVIPHGDFGPLFARYGCNDALADRVREASRGRRVAAFLGLIRPYKGLDVFVDAFPLIRERAPGVFLLVAGASTRVDPGDWDQVFADASEAGDVWADIRFLPVEDLKAYLSVTDVLVQPYIHASQSGNTVMAYAAGVPVISTAVSGLKEMTEDGKTGFIVPPRDPEALAAAVARCFEGNAYESLSANARAAAAERYSWTEIARQTAAVYDRLSAGPSGAGDAS